MAMPTTPEQKQLLKRARALGLEAGGFYNRKREHHYFEITFLNEAQFRHLVETLEASGGVPALSATEREKVMGYQRKPTASGIATSGGSL